MPLVSEAIQSDTALAPAMKYLIAVVAPFFEMPLTGDTDKVREFELGKLIGEAEALIYRLPPSPSNNQRMRFIAGQITDFAAESGAPLGSDDSFTEWIRKNGTDEDKVMAVVFELDRFLEGAYTMGGSQVAEAQSIKKNLLVNFNILQDLQQTMILGGPGSQDELDAFNAAVDANMGKARRLLDSYSYI